MLFNLSYICLIINFVFDNKIFLGRRPCYFMESKGGVGMNTQIVHCQFESEVVSCLLSVCVTCMLGNIYI
jgi:hypothetical protein